MTSSCFWCAAGKDDGLVKELRTKLKDQEAIIATLRANVSNLEAKTDLLVEKKALEVELRMRKQIEDAYEKGFASCKEQFVALKQLQSLL